jgi:hypothetical protein
MEPRKPGQFPNKEAALPKKLKFLQGDHASTIRAGSILSFFALKNCAKINFLINVSDDYYRFAFIILFYKRIPRSLKESL